MDVSPNPVADPPLVKVIWQNSNLIHSGWVFSDQFAYINSLYMCDLSQIGLPLCCDQG